MPGLEVICFVFFLTWTRKMKADAVGFWWSCVLGATSTRVAAAIDEWSCWACKNCHSKQQNDYLPGITFWYIFPVKIHIACCTLHVVWSIRSGRRPQNWWLECKMPTPHWNTCPENRDLLHPKKQKTSSSKAPIFSAANLLLVSGRLTPCHMAGAFELGERWGNESRPPRKGNHFWTGHGHHLLRIDFLGGYVSFFGGV